MAGEIEKGKDSVAKLVRHFRDNADYVRSGEYKEADARQEFIDPFFIALGWDVHNEKQFAPQNREVIPEPSIEVEGGRRAPDYVFRLGQTPKFFAEAKKPGVSVKDDPLAAYQLRRYAWSAKLPLSVLTDFEETSLYDCRIHPKHSDKAAAARVKYIQFEEYADRWQEIWEILSREAVWGGAFDKFTESGRGKRGTSEVDAEFLTEIEFWREALARNIALRNPKLSVDDLNAAVQLTIDRIIFLRMAEDRGIEVYEQLLRLSDGTDIYRRFIKDICRRADEKYNSGLFDLAKDRVTPRLAVDDKLLKDIIGRLYFPACPYEFSVLPVEILGSVYERFLGKVIRLTGGHQAKIEEKPEVKKAGGVYYTPSYIVDYIVKNTVGKWLDENAAKRPAARRTPLPAKFRILDMACGSGSFLLGAYKYLLDYSLKWYEGNDPGRFPKAVTEGPAGWRLTTAERKRILVEHIFGVDIDHQAVEVTKLSLLLKVLEGESSETLESQLRLFHERALPDLAANIKCGNSLIGPDYFTGSLVPDPEEMRRVNPFDWKHEFPEAFRDGGFDCVIGNPPYVRIQTMREWAPLEVEIYKQKYASAAAGNYDVYVVFVEKGLSLLNSAGRLGFIVPSKFLSTDYGAGIRKVITSAGALSQIVDFGHDQVFRASTYTCLLFLSSKPAGGVQYARVQPPSGLSSGNVQSSVLPSDRFTGGPWVLLTRTQSSLSEKIQQRAKNLGELPSHINRGSSSGADDVFVLRRDDGVLQARDGTDADVEVGILRTPIYATDFGRYLFAPRSGEAIIFPYAVDGTGYHLLDERAFKSRFPKALSYLAARSKELRQRKQFSAWYGFSAPRNLQGHDKAQILVPLLADKGSFCRLRADATEYCLMASGGFSITVGEACGLSPNYVLGVLNSRLLFWKLKSISNIFRGGWITCTKQYVEKLPIRTIDFSDRRDKSRHDEMVTRVDQMLELNKRLHDAKSDRDRELYKRQIDATDREIDRLVYELYELTEEEIGIVEGAR